MKKVQDLGATWHSMLWHFEDVDYNDKKLSTFCRIKKQETEDDPTREETDQSKALGWLLWERTEGQKTGFASQIIYAGKNKPEKQEGGKTAPAGSQQDSDTGIYLAKNYEDLDKSFNKFENFGEETKHSAHSGRPIAEGEAVMVIPGTGEMKSHQRFVGDVGTVIIDQESGKYSNAWFAMNGKAIDERLNAGPQTAFNVRKDLHNDCVLALNMHDGCDGIPGGHGYFWWKNWQGLTISPHHEWGPFKFGTQGSGKNGEKHFHDYNEDGQQINSLHFSKSRTFFHESPREDAPNLYEGETFDRGDMFDISQKIWHHYFDPMKHPFKNGSESGYYIWVGTIPIDVEDPPKDPDIVITPGKGRRIPKQDMSQGDGPIQFDLIPENLDYYVPSGHLQYKAPHNVNQRKKFNTRYAPQNLSMPCLQIVGQVPNQYMGEEGWDFKSQAGQEMLNPNFRAGLYSWNPNLQYQSLDYQKEYIAGLLKQKSYQQTKFNRPFICSIDGIFKAQTDHNKKKVDYTHHPGNSSHAFRRGTADGMVLISPPERSNHWDSGALALSTLDWSYYKTVPMGWINEVDDTATMTDVKSTFLIPDEVGGELNLDLWFYTTGAARAGTFTVHGWITTTTGFFKPDDIPEAFGNTTANPDFSILWDTTLTPHGFHLRDNAVTANAGLRITTARVEHYDGMSNTAFGVDSMLSIDALSANNTFVGCFTANNAALNNAMDNTGVGMNVMSQLTQGDNNVGVGVSALTLLADGYNNTAVAYAGLSSNVSGSNNSVFGFFSGANTTGSRNLFLGTYSGYRQAAVNDVFLLNNTGVALANAAAEYTNSLMYGVFNAAPANQMLRINVARLEVTDQNKNLMIGENSGLNRNAGAQYNTAVGHLTLDATLGAGADFNNVYGYFSLSDLQTGKGNCAYGYGNQANNVAGSYNSTSGHLSGQNITGSNNLFAGAYSGTFQAAVSNYIIFDTINRGNAANELTFAPIRAVTNAVVANQHVYHNANRHIPDDVYDCYGSADDASIRWLNASNRMEIATTPAGSDILMHAIDEIRLQAVDTLLYSSAGNLWARFVPSGANYYMQFGTSAADANANLNFTRMLTGANPGLKSVNFVSEKVYVNHSTDSIAGYRALEVHSVFDTPANTANAKVGLYVHTTTAANAFNYTGDIVALNFWAYHNGTGTVTKLYGVNGSAVNNAAGDVTTLCGSRSYTMNTADSAGNIGEAIGFWALVHNLGTGNITDGYGVKIENPLNTGGGNYTDFFGIHITHPTGATNNYPIYVTDGVNESYLGGSYKIVRQLDVEGYAAIGDGFALDPNHTMQVCRTFTQTAGTYASQLDVTCQIDGITADGAYGAVFAPTAMNQKDAAGITPIIASVRIDEPKLAVGADPLDIITDAASLWITGEPDEADTLNAGLIVDANSYFGAPTGHTDYLNISEVGQVTLTGAARVTIEDWIGANSIKAPGAKPATWISHGMKGAWQFADAIIANQESVSGTYKIQTGMDRTVNVIFHIGWSADGISPGDCEWQLEYTWYTINQNTTAAADTTITVTSTASATANGLIIAAFPALTIPGAADKAMFWRITRLSAHANDTISDTTELHGIYLEYTSDKLGEAI